VCNERDWSPKKCKKGHRKRKSPNLAVEALKRLLQDVPGKIEATNGARAYDGFKKKIGFQQKGPTLPESHYKNEDRNTAGKEIQSGRRFPTVSPERPHRGM